jgi:hypothetical protein
MGIKHFAKNLLENSDWQSTSNAGLFNIESGWASFRTEWMSNCGCIDGENKVQHACKKCNRSMTNSLSIPAGDGDGLYTVITFHNKTGEVFASATFFDEGSKLAQEFIQQVEAGTIVDFAPKELLFEDDLPGLVLGKLRLSDEKKVYYSDLKAGLDSPLATLWTEDWVAGGISAFAFVEPSTDSTLAQLSIGMGSDVNQFNGGLEGSIRPRILLLVSDAYRDLTKDIVDIELSNLNWEDQLKAWGQQQVTSHFEDQSDVAIYWNGRLQNQFARRAGNDDGGDEAHFAFREFSWYLQGATFGHQACADAVQEMIEESDDELLEVDLLRGAYLFRGLLTKAKSVN